MNILVIPVYKHYDLTHKLLFSLFQKERGKIGKIIVVDDCSEDKESSDGLDWWKTQWDVLEIVRNDENLGFLKTSNLGLKFAKANPEDIVILLSNDVIIHGEFLWQIEECLRDNVRALVGGVVYQKDTGWNKFGDKIFPYLEGWLLATTQKGWEELGWFDERFAPFDFEDVDLSTTALSKSFSLVALNSPALRHMGGQSIGFNPKRVEQTKTNQKKFEEKWIKK